MGIGLLFPGQASQFAGMGKELYEAYPAARAVFREASDAAGMDLAALCFRGTDEELRLTENTQPAIFTVSVAAFRVLEAETGVTPLCAAGHSLGEYSALVAAGALSVGDAARVLRSRGRYMQEAVRVGEGAMAALIGLSPESVEAVCRAAAGMGVVEPANFNGGDQIVISGSAAAVQAACEAARSAGAKRALPLPVSAPFHCSLMRPAADRLAPELRAVAEGTFRFPVVANVSAEPYPPGAPVADLLLRQIAAPVRWEACVRRMRGMGASSFIEVGPGKVLSGLLRRIDRDAGAASFCAPADLEGARAVAG
ncbi:MAG: ACP S-malonyltransferase [Deltaproteobacteria bacterium]|nr:ACP S-malonyltransferase [Deltaproteobacteria bacterium]PWB62227.1 MAG: [acyl-carrier-protein] S-malonyltransferase [Deltaproteobacteria bacterium]